MSLPKMYRPVEPERRMARCACGCGQDGPFGFPGGQHYAYRHWPDGLVVLDARGRFTATAPALPADEEAGAPAPSDLFGQPESSARSPKRPPGRTGQRSA